MAQKGNLTKADYLDFDSTLNKAFKILKGEKNYKIAMLTIMGINMGLRVSDLRMLMIEDLEGGELVLVEQKTGKNRIIKLNDNVKRALEIYIDRAGKESGYLFETNQGTVMSVQYMNRKLKALFGKKGLNVSSHSLRKTFGRRVWENNNMTDKALLYLSELFNHTSVAITRIYLGIRQEELDDIYLSL